MFIEANSSWSIFLHGILRCPDKITDASSKPYLARWGCSIRFPSVDGGRRSFVHSIAAKFQTSDPSWKMKDRRTTHMSTPSKELKTGVKTKWSRKDTSQKKGHQRFNSWCVNLNSWTLLRKYIYPSQTEPWTPGFSKSFWSLPVENMTFLLTQRQYCLP